MTKINTIWKEMEKDNSNSAGLLLRRYSPHILVDAFIGLRQPEKMRCIVIGLKSEFRINTSDYNNLKDIKVELSASNQNQIHHFLIISLSNIQHEEVFAILCEDLMTAIENESNQTTLTKELLNRLEQWKSLFEIVSIHGLSQDEQRGLYGELYLIKKWLVKATDLQKPIKAWLGPNKEIRDFQFADWGIEAKTTHGNNHQKIQINSERQLDKSTLTSLFLFHISLEVQHRNGETLNHIVDSILQLLDPDLFAQSQFKSKLLQAGYFSQHRNLYENHGYQIRQESWYTIKDDFPRIEEKDIRRGIGDVKYTIIISDQKSYIVDESQIFDLIK